MECFYNYTQVSWWEVASNLSGGTIVLNGTPLARVVMFWFWTSADTAKNLLLATSTVEGQGDAWLPTTALPELVSWLASKSFVKPVRSSTSRWEQRLMWQLMRFLRYFSVAASILQLTSSSMLPI